LVSLYAQPEEQGAALGVFRSIGSLGRAIGPITASVIFWWWGSDTLYVIGSGVVALAVVLCLRLPKPVKSEA
jgi:MFS family permease